MRFSKLHGAGNDYIYVDARGGERDWPELARQVSDRHFGIGADGLILLKNSEVADARMQMFNADGSEGMMCGNGIRCFIRFGLDNSALSQATTSFDIETASGVLNVRPIWESGAMTRASVGMGAPIFRSSDIPVNAPGELNPVLNYPITVNGSELPLTCVSMGNPHAVMFLDQPVEDYPLTTIGPKVENHPVFPSSTQAGSGSESGSEVRELPLPAGLEPARQPWQPDCRDWSATKSPSRCPEVSSKCPGLGTER